jgi:hypothetical protein
LIGRWQRLMDHSAKLAKCQPRASPGAANEGETNMTYRERIDEMLRRISACGPAALDTAVELLGRHLTLQEIEAAAIAAGRQAAEASDRKLYRMGEASARRLLGK